MGERQRVTTGLGVVERYGEGNSGLKESAKTWQEVVLSHMTQQHGK